MRFRTRLPEDPEINLAPLIDVVFILLIFFMVATTFDREVELKVQLPEASGEARPQEPVLELTIDAQARYYVNGEQVANRNVETLARALGKVAANRNDALLVLTVDATAPHQAVISAMDAARQAGLTRLTFTARESGR